MASCGCPLMLEPGAGDAHYCARANASVGLRDREHDERGAIVTDDASAASDDEEDGRRVRAMTASGGAGPNPAAARKRRRFVAGVDKLLRGWTLW